MFRSTRRTQLVCLLVLAFLLSASSGCSYSERRRAKAIARGHQLFEMHCSGCHSQRRHDLGKVPPDLHGVFDGISLPSGRSATDDMVRSTILTGRSGIMPSFEGSLSDENIQDIILYLHTLKTPPKAATPAAVTPVGAATLPDKSMSEMAFHEKAGRSQVGSCWFGWSRCFFLAESPLSPPFHPHSG